MQQKNAKELRLLNSYKKFEQIKTNQGNEVALIGLSDKINQVLVIGVVHGDEPQGEYLINRYISEFKKDGVLFIPCLNPDGMALGIRTNSNGVDLNRNFPTQNWILAERDKYFGGESPASEVETRFLVKIIEKYKPSAIITLHTPYKIVNYDGPAEELAQMVSDIFGYPVELSIGYSTPGSFGTYAGVERKIPTITLEMDEEIEVEELYPPAKAVFDKLNR